jgi:hypothetical protein
MTWLDKLFDKKLKEKPMAEEPEVKECRNHRCSRRYVPVIRESLYCSNCGAKLRPADHAGDAPPLTDVAPDVQRRGGPAVCGVPEPTNGHAPIALPSHNPTKKLEGHPTREQWIALGGSFDGYNDYLESVGLETFQQSKLNYDDWQAYLHKNGVGLWTAEDCKGIRIVKEKKPKGKVVNISSATKSDTFSCADEDVTGCPLVDKAKIEMPNSMYHAWVYLTKVFETEWIAYLKGEQRKDGVWEIKSMYFPPQTVNAAHVDVPDEFKIEEGTIGAVHSHVAMAVFFSGEDKKHMNHPIELIVNRKGEVAAAVAIVLDCGRTSRIEADITLMGNTEQTALKDDLKSKLKKETPSYSTGGYNYNRNYNYQNREDEALRYYGDFTD